jgi:hypothetical protein
VVDIVNVQTGSNYTCPAKTGEHFQEYWYYFYDRKFLAVQFFLASAIGYMCGRGTWL